MNKTTYLLGKTFAKALVFFIISISFSFSQDLSVKYAQSIKAEDLATHLSIIASDSFEGRNTASHGQKLAAAYISNQFKNYGLKPAIHLEDSFSYYQPFKVYKQGWNEPYLNIDGKEYKFFNEFFSLASPDIENEEKLQTVFGGFGDENLSTSEVSGKAVIVFSNLIKEADAGLKTRKINNLILSSNFNRKYREILNKGARAVFIIPGENDSTFRNFLNDYRCVLEEEEIFVKEKEYVTNNLFFISPSVGAQMLGISTSMLNRLQQSQNFSKSILKAIKHKEIRIKVARKIEPVETENVLGFIEGTDLKEEVLILTAHYDHEGIKCGEIYNGADDDGTGTSSILEIAQAFAQAKKEGHSPRRSILFMTLTGEEKGLLGSSFYVKNPVFPIVKTIANLNIDMIGRIDEFHHNENYVYIIGSDRLSNQLHTISEEVNKKYLGLYLDYKYNALNDPNQFYYRSDHYNFAKNNIPVIFYFSGVHEDYHQPTDDVDKILFSKVEKTARLIFHTAWELANREERISVDVK